VAGFPLRSRFRVAGIPLREPIFRAAGSAGGPVLSRLPPGGRNRLLTKVPAEGSLLPVA
jgi:hypothetical protein